MRLTNCPLKLRIATVHPPEAFAELHARENTLRVFLRDKEARKKLTHHISVGEKYVGLRQHDFVGYGGLFNFLHTHHPDKWELHVGVGRRRKRGGKKGLPDVWDERCIFWAIIEFADDESFVHTRLGWPTRRLT